MVVIHTLHEEDCYIFEYMGKQKQSKKTESALDGALSRLVSREQRQQILGVCLLGISLFTFVSLLPVLPVSWVGGMGETVGIVGGTLGESLDALIGYSAFLVPFLLLFLGLHVGEWIADIWPARLSVLTAGLIVLLPVFIYVWQDPSTGAGWFGKSLGEPLEKFMGTTGATIVTGTGLVILSIVTLAWNPLISVYRGMLASGEMAGRTAKAVADRGREFAEARAQVAVDPDLSEAASGDPLPGLEPEWMESQEDEEKVTPESDVLPPDNVDPDPLPDEVPDLRDLEDASSDVVNNEDLESTDLVSDEVEVDESESAPTDTSEEAEIEHEVPPMALLSGPDNRDDDDMDRQLEELGHILIEKLLTFNVESSLGDRTTGPMVTQFEVVPAPGVKVNRIANLDADLALAMKAKSVRIVAPIPGRGAVGVEIPNPKPEIVNLREVLEAPEFKRAKGELPLALGKDLNGRPYVSSLEKMPHVLIAGATGSGKSVCLNTIVTSLVYRHTPETLRLLMIDPKMVELSVYSRLPHLRHNVVTDPRDAAGLLKWAVIEMERRYGLLKANYVRSIAEFNRKVRDGVTMKRFEPDGPEGFEDRWIYQDGIIPYIVVVVDELADLMVTVQAEVEKPLTQLAQKARAIGIHLIVATQRPSVNVITGLIKANFPTRIAFRVASKTDSRTILDQNGADALLGNGDMLFLPPGESDPVRIQGAYLPTEDTERLMGWYTELIEQHGEGVVSTESGLETDILEEMRGREAEEAELAAEEIGGEWDELFQEAAEVCIQNGTGSTSLLQRRLSIGYGRAARIVDQLFDAGVLGPSDGAKGREVLMSMSDLSSMFGFEDDS